MLSVQGKFSQSRKKWSQCRENSLSAEKMVSVQKKWSQCRKKLSQCRKKDLSEGKTSPQCRKNGSPCGKNAVSAAAWWFQSLAVPRRLGRVHILYTVCTVADCSLPSTGLRGPPLPPPPQQKELQIWGGGAKCILRTACVPCALSREPARQKLVEAASCCAPCLGGGGGW